MNLVEFENTDGVLTIWLNRVDKRNAFDEEMATQIIQGYSRAWDDEDVSVVVLRGRGPIFCAGGDIAWMSDVAGRSLDEREKNAKLIADVFKAIADFPQPTISVVHGYVLGGAVGLMACNDFVLATDTVQIATSEAKLGIVPACLAPHLINRIGGTQTRRMFLWAEMVEAEDALRIGLVDRLVSELEIESELQKLVSQLSLTSSTARQTAKQLLIDLLEVEDSKRMDLSVKCLANSWSSPHGREGMKAFVEKRSPQWDVDGTE